jgi:uncharacterized protein involved in type VI secretion and phage assembly
MFAAPNIGDMVDVEFIGGSLDAGVVVARFYNRVSPNRPLDVLTGEFWLVHAKG